MTSMMDGMDESLYGDEPSKGKPESVDEQSEKDATDLMAKSSFPGGCKVGDRYDIEITGDHGDQFSVKVVNDEKDKSEAKSDEGELEDINSKY